VTADEAGIQDVVKQLEDAWNASDSRRFAAQFVEDATFIQIFGGQLDGRTAIEGSHRAIFDTIYKGSTATFTLRSIRFVRPDVAIVFTQTHLKFFQGVEAREMETRPTMVMVKEQAKWHIVVLQNTKISEMPTAAQAASRLAT
jgi:uncharacterized protein (TIGR02246 family)